MSEPATSKTPSHVLSVPAEWAASTTRPSEFGSPADGDGRSASGAAQAAAASELCHPALALRAVIGVQAALLLAALAVSEQWSNLPGEIGTGSSAGLMGTLSWLVCACGLRRSLSAAPMSARVAALLVLAMVIAWLSWAPLVAMGLSHWSGPRLVGVPMLGAAMAAPLIWWLETRAAARRPADASARLAELQSRIRPHFLFNALNTAIALVRIDPSRAEAVLEDLAQLFRVALAEPRPAMLLADEIELAQRYLAIEQLRFGDRMRVQWEVDPAAGVARMPPLVLQPLVENAVRHGVEPSPDGGTIHVRTRVRRGQAEITIDNSVGDAPPNPGHGIALANVRERLRLLHDVGAQFEARRDGDRYRVRIVVPIERMP